MTLMNKAMYNVKEYNGKVDIHLTTGSYLPYFGWSTIKRLVARKNTL